MSTSKHINKICIAVIAIALIITIALLGAVSKGCIGTDKSIGYEKRIFSIDKVHTIDIVMNDWDTFIENCESEEYSECTVVIDGEKFSNIALRAKGNTSLSSVKSMNSQRYSFKLEFDQYDKTKSYYGLDKLCLNNLIQDNTMMKDYLVYQMMYEFGVDAPLSSYVYITVNGEDWGLYLAVEGIEESFLQRNYGTDYGDLYKPDSLSFGGGRGNGKEFDINDLDFERSDTSDSDMKFSFEQNSKFEEGDIKNRDFGKEDGFNMFGGFGGMGSDDVKLKYIDDNSESYSNIFNSAKTDVTQKDQERLISSLKSLSEYKDLEDVLDVEEVLRYFVIHNFVDNGDSYTGSMIHNYYLYEENGKLSMIPWDYNLAYGTFMGNNASSSVNSSIDNPVDGDINERPMVGWIFSDKSYTKQYHEFFEEFLDEWFISGKFSKLIEETKEMISPYVEKDPTKFCTTEEFENGVDTIFQYMSLRAQAVGMQLSGDDSLVDASGLNISSMGTMGGTGDRGGMRPTGEAGDRGGMRPTGEAGDKSFPGFGDGNMQPPNMGDSGSFPGFNGGNVPSFNQLSSETKTVPLLAGSALVLLVGLFVAIKKK